MDIKSLTLFFCLTVVLFATADAQRFFFRNRRQGRGRGVTRFNVRCILFGDCTSTTRGPSRPDREPSVDTLARNYVRRSLDNIPNLVQMVFHVCVGGCDGCLNLNDDNNKGLVESYPDAKSYCESSLSSLSLADCIVLLASKAVEIGFQRAGERVSVPFTTGRTTCSDPNNYNLRHTFPDASSPDALNTLQRLFSLTNVEAVALLGAHSLGRAKRRNTGFNGPWDRTENTLDNGYYQNMLDNQWIARSNRGQTQFESTSGNFMMLPADMACLYSFRQLSDGRYSCSNSNRCFEDRQSAPTVRLYARSQRRWSSDFVDAFVKMCNARS